jgi:uridine phosphorylase
LPQTYLHGAQTLSDHRGLHSSLAFLGNGTPVISATSGMGAPSLSIVVNELVQVGITTIIRVGTCGSIQPQVMPGHVVVSQAALCRQGAVADIAPTEFPSGSRPLRHGCVDECGEGPPDSGAHGSDGVGGYVL